MNQVKQSLVLPRRHPGIWLHPTTDYLSCGDPTLFRLTTAFSISLWFAAPAVYGVGQVFLVSKTAHMFSNGWILGWNVYAGFSFSVNHQFLNAATYYVSESEIYRKPWHLVGTYDQSNIKLYVNGSLQATTPYTSAIIDGGNLVFGGVGSTAGDYASVLRQVILYNRALTAGEVATLAQGGLVTDGRIGHWPLTSTSVITDISGNGNNGIGHGSPVDCQIHRRGGVIKDGALQ